MFLEKISNPIADGRSVHEAKGQEDDNTTSARSVLPVNPPSTVWHDRCAIAPERADEASPLAGKSVEELERTQAEILVLLSGTDETFEQTVHARSSDSADEIVWNARFQSMFRPTDARARVSIDISRIHAIEPL